MCVSDEHFVSITAYSSSLENQNLTDTLKKQETLLHDVYSSVAGEKQINNFCSLWMIKLEDSCTVEISMAIRLYCCVIIRDVMYLFTEFIVDNPPKGYRNADTREAQRKQ